ncbi:hypothetical protein ACOBR2_05950 [Telmatobacter bradus]
MERIDARLSHTLLLAFFTACVLELPPCMTLLSANQRSPWLVKPC